MTSPPGRFVLPQAKKKTKDRINKDDVLGIKMPQPELEGSSPVISEMFDERFFTVYIIK